jgi:CHAT domain-containing protein/uncharacterized protein HemY
MFLRTSSIALLQRALLLFALAGLALFLAFLTLTGVAQAQTKVANPGFEEGGVGSVPSGWIVQKLVRGFEVKLTDKGCRSGTRCAMMTGVANPGGAPGNLIQILPAAGYTLHRIRLLSAIRVEGEQTHAQMWLRLDRADNTPVFFENMVYRPVTSSQWNTYDIEADVADDVSQIVFGVMLFGGGTAWVDDISLDILGDVFKDGTGPTQRLTPGSLAYLEQALALARRLENRLGEANTLLDLGKACSMANQNDKAVSYYDQALAMYRELKDRGREGWALFSLGNSWLRLSQFERSISYYEQALAVYRELKDRDGEGPAVQNLGTAYAGLSQYEKAIFYWEQALEISREVNNRIGRIPLAARNRSGEGIALATLGEAYLWLSQYEKAISYFEQALAIPREAKDRDLEGDYLNSIGVAYSRLGQYEKGIGYCEKALAIHREVRYGIGESNSTGEGNSLESLGVTYRRLGQYGKGIGYSEQALAFYRKINRRDGEVSVLTELGYAYAGLSQYGKAIGYYEQALAIAREIKTRDNEAESLSGLMDVWKSSGEPRLAVFYGKQAVNTIQSIRSDMRSLTADLQQSFLKGNEKPYHSLADLLIAQGRLAEAEQVLGLLKEQEYFDYVRRDPSEAATLNRRADPTAEEAVWEKRYREVGDRLMTIGTERGALMAATTLTAEQTRRLAQLDQDLAVGNQAFEKFLGDLATNFSTKPEAGAKLQQLRDAQGIMGDLGELPPGTVAIYTVVGEEKYRAILVTPQVEKAYEYPIAAADLNRKILEFREVVGNPKLDPRPLAQELYTILLGNMAADLRQANAKTLMWSLDGTLRYLPLAALYDGKHYIIEQYRLAVFTPASNARLKDHPSTQWNIAGFGVTKAHEDAPALPSVAAELSGIVLQKTGTGGVLEGEIDLDEDFTQTSMRTALLKHYAVVHIASHFRFQPGNDATSFLLLGDGSHLSLAELNNLPSLFDGVQLLTLSACNTGMGDATGDGKEVEGFGVLAQRKGAKAVIASLWPVADASTSLLMREFYRIWESSPGITKAEALVEAQLGLLRGTAKPLEVPAAERALVHEAAPGTGAVKAPSFRAPKDAPYAHPYYWAPFFLMGNGL